MSIIETIIINNILLRLKYLSEVRASPINYSKIFSVSCITLLACKILAIIVIFNHLKCFTFGADNPRFLFDYTDMTKNISLNFIKRRFD